MVCNVSVLTAGNAATGSAPPPAAAAADVCELLVEVVLPMAGFSDVMAALGFLVMGLARRLGFLTADVLPAA